MDKIRVIILFVFSLIFVFNNIYAKDNFKLNISPPIPDTSPVEINTGCNKCGWVAHTTKESNGQSKAVNSSIMFMNNVYRVEMLGDNTDNTQIIIFDNIDLYVLNSNDKTAMLYKMAEAESKLFLEAVFPSISVKKNNRTIIGSEIYDNTKCDVISYRLITHGSFAFVWGTATEWLDKKSGRTMKITVVSDKSEIPFNNKNLVVESEIKTYEAGPVKKFWFMDKNIFVVPKDYKIIDMKKSYNEILKKEKNIEPSNGYEYKKFNMNPKAKLK